MRAQERINFIRGIGKQMRIRKEINILNSVNHQTTKMNTGEGKEQTTLESIRKNSIKIVRISKYLPVIVLNANGFNSPIKR
jgi:hypothetical protein